MKRIIKHPLFLLFEALLGINLLVSDLPYAIFDWKITGLLMIAHSVGTMLCLVTGLIKKEEK